MFLPRTIGILGGAFVYHHHHHPHNHHHHHCHHDYHPHLHYDYITVMIQGIMEMMFSNFCRTEKSRKLFTLTSHHRANIQSSILLMIIFLLDLYLLAYLSHFLYLFLSCYLYLSLILPLHITKQASKAASFLCPCVTVFIFVVVYFV